MLTRGERLFRWGLHLTIGLLVAFTAFVVIFEPKQAATAGEVKPLLCSTR